MRFTLYINEGIMRIKAGDKLPMTVSGKAPGLLMYGIKDENNNLLVSDGLTLCSDPHDQNYIDADKMESMPEDIIATVLDVESVFGVHTVTINIEERDAM